MIVELTGGKKTVNTAKEARMAETAKTYQKPSIRTAGLKLVEKFMFLVAVVTSASCQNESLGENT